MVTILLTVDWNTFIRNARSSSESACLSHKKTPLPWRIFYLGQTSFHFPLAGGPFDSEPVT